MLHELVERDWMLIRQYLGFSVDGGSETWCMKPTPNDKSDQEVVVPSSIPVSRGETKIIFLTNLARLNKSPIAFATTELARQANLK